MSARTTLAEIVALIEATPSHLRNTNLAAKILELAKREDTMPPGWNRPAPASQLAVADTLRDALEEVQAGDSWEGFIQWSMPTDEPELAGAEFGLMARYRIGNLAGQGGLRVYTPTEET